jgi:hypothetical protein
MEVDGLFVHLMWLHRVVVSFSAPSTEVGGSPGTASLHGPKARSGGLLSSPRRHLRRVSASVVTRLFRVSRVEVSFPRPKPRFRSLESVMFRLRRSCPVGHPPDPLSRS